MKTEYATLRFKAGSKHLMSQHAVLRNFWGAFVVRIVVRAAAQALLMATVWLSKMADFYSKKFFISTE